MVEKSCNEPQPHVNHITMVTMVPLLTSVDGYYTTFCNHIAMVLTPLRDPGKTMVEPHFILQGHACMGEVKAQRELFWSQLRTQLR